MSRHIDIIAHRGGGGNAPENTLAAFRAAIDAGADFVEIDVRTTRDGKLVLAHDRTVDRTTNGVGAVNELDFDAIRSLDAGVKFGAEFVGEHVPTPDEALELCRGRVSIYLDHKNARERDVVNAVERFEMLQRAVIYGDVPVLREWKLLAPDVPVMPTLPRDHRRPGGVSAFIETFAAEFLDGAVENWSTELVAEAHAAGCRVFLDCLGERDNENGYRKAIEMDVDGIQTDYPDRLAALLTAVGRRT